MKKITYLVTLIFIITNISLVNAQNALKLSYKDVNGFHDITFNPNDKTIWVMAQPVLNIKDPTGFYITENQYNEVMNAFLLVKDKYIEWIDIANKNNITKLSKEIPVNVNIDCFFLEYKWHFEFNKKITCIFETKLDNGIRTNKLIIKSGRITSSSSAIFYHYGFEIEFSSFGQYANFLYTLSKENLKTKSIKMQQEDNLFK